MPKWRGDGRELFYISPDLQLMAVEVKTGLNFETGPPQALFSLPVPGIGGFARHYDVSADGQRFLVESLTEGSQSAIAVVLNWTAALALDGKGCAEFRGHPRLSCQCS